VLQYLSGTAQIGLEDFTLFMRFRFGVVEVLLLLYRTFDPLCDTDVLSMWGVWSQRVKNPNFTNIHEG